MQVLNLGERKFIVSKGELKPQDVVDLPKEEAEHLKAMFKDEIKLIEEKPKKEGKKEGKIEIAKNMLMENEPIDKIARYTGLAKEDILKLN